MDKYTAYYDDYANWCDELGEIKPLNINTTLPPPPPFNQQDFIFTRKKLGLIVELFEATGLDGNFLVDEFSKLFCKINLDIYRIIMTTNNNAPKNTTFKFFMQPKQDGNHFQIMYDFKYYVSGLISTLNCSTKCVRLSNDRINQTYSLVEELKKLNKSDIMVVFGDDDFAKYTKNQNIVNQVYSENPHINTKYGLFARKPVLY